MSTRSSMNLSNLQLLDWSEHRGVSLKTSGSGSRDLVPTVNSVVLLNVQFQDGPPFTISLDGGVFWGSMAPFLPGLQPTFDHVCLLGWYDEKGRGFLTTWDGERPVRSFVVTGVDSVSMPLLQSPVPSGAKLHLVPMGEDPQAHAKKLGGFHAVGWYMPSMDRLPGASRQDSVRVIPPR